MSSFSRTLATIASALSITNLNGTFANNLTVTANVTGNNATITNTLTVSGNVTISNTRITANGSTGTAGQALVSGGTNSNVYWGAGGSSNAKIHAISMFIGG